MDLDVQRVEDPGSKLLELFSLFYNLTYIGLFAYVFWQTGILHTLSPNQVLEHWPSVVLNEGH